MQLVQHAVVIRYMQHELVMHACVCLNYSSKIADLSYGNLIDSPDPFKVTDLLHFTDTHTTHRSHSLCKEREGEKKEQKEVGQQFRELYLCLNESADKVWEDQFEGRADTGEVEQRTKRGGKAGGRQIRHPPHYS